MRVLFALPGLHRYHRGAEAAFIALARELAKGSDTVTLIGSGKSPPEAPYRFLRAASCRRERFERFPSIPLLRSEFAYEELTFVPALLWQHRPADHDVTLTCSYPFTNWVLRRPVLGGKRPPHVFVTQNGDWPAQGNGAEFKYFGCEGLVCTNPDFYERNKSRWRCRLIPNGVDCDRFQPGPPQRREFGLPEGGLVVLMVSALSPGKRIEVGIEAVSRIPDAHMVVAGDGPLRKVVDATAARLLPGRFTRISVASERMAALYRSADVFLHLAKDESFGNVFIEAMACGIPIVAHDSSRLRWIVGDDEYLFSTDDPAAIAEQIGFARRAPPGGARTRAAKATAFSWPRIGRSYREFLEEIVALHRRKP
jgi:glycosyltransferase involved in cell wall biosynthesis